MTSQSNDNSARSLQAIEQIISDLAGQDYIATNQIATAVHVAQALEKPILVEGPAGVGKTELSKAVAQMKNLPLIRLQCYEGLDESKALYEWKYGKQLLYTQILREKLGDVLQGAQGLAESMQRLHQYSDVFFDREFLAPRPLLQALQSDDGAVLLIDEIDKADYEFESLLLEVLSDFQVSVPELGTVRAQTRPLVFLTSNNARELSDALKRRCIHLYIDLPDSALEARIVASRVPGVPDKLNAELVGFVQALRQLELKKLPAISETIDWAQTLLLLNAERLDRALVENTLNVLLKFREDIEQVEEQLPTLLAGPKGTRH